MQTSTTYYDVLLAAYVRGHLGEAALAPPADAETLVARARADR